LYTGGVDARTLPTPGTRIDLLLAYDWLYDEPFLALLGETFRSTGKSLMLVSPSSLPGAMEQLRSGRIVPRAYLDRASDTDPNFQPLEDWAGQNVSIHLNPARRRREIWRKTNLHWEFIHAGLHTPYTIVVPSHRRQPAFEHPPDLSPLSVPFSIKPDLGGGGWGVVTDARTWADVEKARCSMPDEDLILQQFVEPTLLVGRRAWFRIFYACGLVVPCWWDDRTHLFGPAVTAEERWRLRLNPLWRMAQTAAQIAQLQLFSTEVALVQDGRFIVVDYVNDPVDLRILPYAREGMPREVAWSLAGALATYLGQLP